MADVSTSIGNYRAIPDETSIIDASDIGTGSTVGVKTKIDVSHDAGRDGGICRDGNMPASSGMSGGAGNVILFKTTEQIGISVGRAGREIENVIPCFTPGSLIATPKGEVPVETLHVGDKVITRDNGIQEIRWTGRRILTRDELNRAPHLQPVRIKAGALGYGLPERDMLVSPQHRMLIAGDRSQRYFEESEVLVAARHLVRDGAIHKIAAPQTTYIHFMFDRHEVILCNGAWTESFQPGDQTLGAMGQAARDEIVALFPELATPSGVNGYSAARRALKGDEAKLLQL